jgi:ABC-type sulfate/molybdate transport systems ATPase subunit
VRADGGLLPHLSVRANIGWGLLDVLELHPKDLSPGRRLRVGLARALLRSPVAVALEERGDRPSRAGQLPQRELLDGVASLVVTDDADRLAGFADVVVEPSASGEVG